MIKYRFYTKDYPTFGLVAELVGETEDSWLIKVNGQNNIISITKSENCNCVAFVPKQKEGWEVMYDTIGRMLRKNVNM